jgi:hypothetical protein
MIAAEIVKQQEGVHAFGIAKTKGAVQVHACALHSGAGAACGGDRAD